MSKMVRYTVITAGLSLAGAAALAAVRPAAAPPAGRGAYDPFAMRRAAEAPPQSQENNALQRRTEIMKWLAANRVLPPGQKKPRSPFRPGPPPTTPPPFTPPGGGVGTNPGGNTPGNGNASRR